MGGIRLATGTLVVLVGPSSSGKSTWAQRWFADEQIVSSDDLRAVVGESRYDQRASADAFEVLERIVTARTGRRLLTVVDTLGLDAGRRSAWVTRARARRMTVIAVRVVAVPRTVRSRNAARQHPLPTGVLSRQLRTMAVTTADVLLAEGFDAVVDLPADGDLAVTVTAPVLRDAPTLTARQLQEPLPMRFGLQVGRFDPDPRDLATHLTDVAVAAEQAGFDSLWLMDHMLQIPQVGREWEDILESWTTLGFLAAATSTIRLGTLVTGVTYRNLAHLAKIVATVDVLSGGRVVCGLGAAWFEREHDLYGWPFPSVAERYDLLRDACELLPLMWGPGSPAFEGRTTSVPEAICYPRPLQEHVPILIGGSGERSTLRLVAEHADACNLFGDPDTVRRLVGVLHDHCADVGRDAAAIEVTNLLTLLSAPDEATLARRVASLTPSGRATERTVGQLNAGTVEDHIGLLRAYAEAGVQTAILSLPVVDVQRVAELAPLIAAFRT